MSDSVQTTFFARLRHTPLRDLVRGRVSGRLDWRGRLVDAKLSPVARELILRVVKRTRLWRIEKAAVADELIAHFLDGLEAGQAVEKLVAAFGDEKAAAKLIRRAKIRNRPLAWQVLRWARRGVAALLLFYIVAGVYFFAGTPSPSVDYIAELNRMAAQVPEGDRGLPLYLPVFRKFEMHTGPEKGEQWSNMLDAKPGSQHWPAMETWLQEHAADVEQIRQAAAKPVMGFVIRGQDSSPAVGKSGQENFRPLNQSLVDAQVHHISNVMNSARVIVADARLASRLSDGQRARRDLETLLNIPKQWHADPTQTLVCDLVAMGIRARALNCVDETLAGMPDIFSDHDLAQLGQQLAEVASARDMIGYGNERMFFYDIVQRMYTDDGHGNGRLTREAIKTLASYQTLANSLIDQETIGGTQVVLGPAAMLVSASRQEIRSVYDELMDHADAQLDKPMRTADWSTYERKMEALKSRINSVRYWPVVISVSPMVSVQVGVERLLGRQDGLRVGVALERYRRRHGAYPAALADLTPTFLSEVPADRITGEPIRYRVINGKPRVYSVGMDRKDDGGEMLQDGGRSFNPDRVAAWGTLPDSTTPRGDWVLYPQPVEKDDEE